MENHGSGTVQVVEMVCTAPPESSAITADARDRTVSGAMFRAASCRIGGDEARKPGGTDRHDIEGRLARKELLGQL
jgi:hypothetical protein